ncbi:MAG: ABC transporter permease [Bacteroidales bacterium]|nr:ABC transporter permease [Bacteroidales bacterium]
MSVIDSYFKTGLRNLQKHRFYSLINILGLAIGIAGSLLIVLYVINEISYDKFHNNYERIYRVGVKGELKGDPINMAVTCAPMAKTLPQEFPEVESVTRIRELGDWLIGSGERKFNEEHFLFADSTFFDIFNFKLILGDSKTALNRPRTMIVTQSAAKKYFGNEDPMGKSIRVENDSTFFEVTGVMEDLPVNSHFHFALLGSMVSYPNQANNDFWISNNFYTYVKLKEGANALEFEPKLRTLLIKYIGPQLQQALGVTVEEFEASGSSYGYFIQPLADIHLKSKLQYELEPGGNMLYVYIFSIAAILILVIACINFMNLATARSAGRAKEVGLRKVVGSDRKRLVFQFLAESMMVAFFALILALLIVELSLPAFNNLLGIQLSVGYFASWYIVPGLILFSIFVGSLAGSYPAFFVSSFSPIAVLKGKLKGGAKSSVLRSVLVVSQFTVTIAILLAATAVFMQIRYFQNKDLGFDKENKLVIKRSDGLKRNMDVFKQEALKIEGVVSIANANSIPGRNYSLNAQLLEGDHNPGTTYTIQQGWVSPGFEKTLGLRLKEGRFLSSDIPTDTLAVVLSEAGVKALGITEPLKHRLYQPGETPRYFNIVGVVEDFHIKSLQSKISPIVLSFMPGNWEGVVVVALSGENNKQAISQLEQLWTNFSEFPFEYYYLEDSLATLYKAEVQTGVVLIAFSVLAIVLSCLGLLGLVSFTTSLRTKEIAVRKTLGASNGLIIGILSVETLRLIGLSTVIALGLSWYAISKWLENYAFRANISPVIYVVIPLLITVVAFLVISREVVKAASRNPAEVLKYE